MSLFGKAKGWLGKRTEPTDRVTRAPASPSTARVSYNDDIVPPELLYEMDTVHAMTYPCSDFLTAAGIKDEFDNLCAAAGLTCLVTRQVTQYPKLTYYFVKWFRYNDKTSMMDSDYMRKFLPCSWHICVIF